MTTANSSAEELLSRLEAAYEHLATRENVTTGEISPGEELEATLWSMAVRTIRDIDLNDNGPGSPGENNLGHLWNRRKAQLNLLPGQISHISDHAERVSIFQEFSRPDKPFSGFIAAYYRQLTAWHLQSRTEQTELSC